MDYQLIDLINQDKVQDLMDSFSRLNGVANGILDLEGGMVTGSGWKRICTQFHRVNEETCARCVESDTVLTRRAYQGEKIATYECKNGLMDGITPIIVNGEHLANLFIGQFLMKPPDIEQFRRQAAEFGFDEADYLDALSEVPILTSEQVTRTLDFLSRLANFIGEMGLARVEQIESAQRLERASLEIIEAQRVALRDLSTPIIPVMENIIVMPLVGSIDTSRAREITRALLAGITEYRAKLLILDVTGVAVVDSGVADHLNKAIQAARLKGAEVILTGISDAVAETVVDLGIDWSSIATMRDLQTGLAAAVERLGITL